MKKYLANLLIIIGLISISNQVQGQFYVKGFTGYSLSTNPFKARYEIRSNNQIYRITEKYRFGQGLNLGLGLGYQLSPNFGFELDINTQFLTRSQFEVNLTDYGTLNQVYVYSIGGGIMGLNRTRHHIIQASPQFVYTIPIKNLKPYLRMGLNILWVNMLSYERSEPDFNGNSRESETRHYGRPKIGFQGAGGLSYTFKTNLEIFGELQIINTRYQMTKFEVQKYKINGRDAPSALQKGEAEFKLDFSSIGLNFGLKYNFGK